MPPHFGTSGLRGLVTDLTDPLVAGYLRAFLQTIPPTGQLLLGRDLRPSSPRIAATLADAAAALGVRVKDCGPLPTPALACAAGRDGIPAVMVTGSHIPADRNGLKFYRATGEITKADEAAITAAYAPFGAPAGPAPEDGTAVATAYAARYVTAYDGALRGLKIGVYQHSSVARDLLAALLARLGAEVTALGRSDSFVAVDTEAIDARTRDRLAGWAAAGAFDAIVSADGDGDRPLVADARGRVIPGDVLGTLAAAALGADRVVTPVSSNTLIEASGRFAGTIRVRIGSPYVIAGMEAAPGRVVGFEPNGGFLLGYEARGPRGPLPALVTRDAILPILAVLAEVARRGQPLRALVAELPARSTHSDRIGNVPSDWTAALLARLSGSRAERAGLIPVASTESAADLTDGLRITYASGEILHLRASRNAPELRCYAEADSDSVAETLVRDTLARIAALRGQKGPE